MIPLFSTIKRVEVERPTYREIDHRLKEAKEALQNGCAVFANQSKVVGEIMELGIGDTNEVWDLIICLLNELTAKDYTGHIHQKLITNPKVQDMNCGLFAGSVHF